jgi:hypothetical protein
VPRSYLEDNWGDPISSVRESGKRELERVKLKNLRSSPAVARERLKTQQAGK